MPHHYHLKIQSAIFWITFFEIALLAVYPSSCVTSSRGYVKSEPKTVEDFLSSYVAAMQLIEKDQNFAERSLAKWTRERDSAVVTQSVESHRRIFKAAPFVPDKRIDNVLKDRASRRSVPREFFSAGPSCFVTMRRWSGCWGDRYIACRYARFSAILRRTTPVS